MAIGFNRGAPAPVDISDAERLAVSTDANSPLQRAIAGSQFLDRGFLDTSDLLAQGPKAMDTALNESVKRSDIKAKMAQGALALTDSAITARQRQATIDSQSEEIKSADEFFTQTEGMTPAEKVKAMSPRDWLNPNITNSFKAEMEGRKSSIGLDAAEIGLRGAQRTDRRDAATEEKDLEIALQERSNTAMEGAIRGRQLLDALAEQDYEPMNFAGAMAEINLPPEHKASLLDKAGAEGEAGASIRAGLRRVFTSQVSVAETMSASPEFFSEDAGASFQKAILEMNESGRVSPATMIEMGEESNRAKKVTEYKVLSAQRNKELSSRLGSLIDLAKDIDSMDPFEAQDEIIEMREKQLEMARYSLKMEKALYANDDEHDFTPLQDDVEAKQQAVSDALDDRNSRTSGVGNAKKATMDWVEGQIKSLTKELGSVPLPSTPLKPDEAPEGSRKTPEGEPKGDALAVGERAKARAKDDLFEGTAGANL